VEVEEEQQQSSPLQCECAEFSAKATVNCRACGKAHSSGGRNRNRKDARAAALGAAVAEVVAQCAYEGMAQCDLPQSAVDFEYFYGDSATVASAEALGAAIARAERAAAETIRAAFAPELEAVERREQLRRRAAQRRHVFEELVATEEEYVRDLNTIDTLWRLGLSKTGLLTPATSASLFGTIPQLAFLSTELLREMQAVLRKPLVEQRLGEVLLKKVPFMRLYIEHCSEQSRVIELVSSFSHDPVFAAFQDETMKDPAAKHLDLAGFLIKPTQRITKYPLLVRDILKYTELDHPDYSKLQQADARLRGVLDEVNEKTKIQESVDLFSSVQSRLRWTNKAYDLVASRCIAYCHGNIRWELVCPSISPEPLARGNYVFVINHFILACNERSKSYVELATFLINLVFIPDQDTSGNDVEVHVLRTDGVSMSFILHPADFLDRQTWFTAIKTCRSKAPDKAPQLVDLSTQRRTVDGTGNFTKAVVPPLSIRDIPSTSAGGSVSGQSSPVLPFSAQEDRKAYLKAGKTRMSLMDLISSRITPGLSVSPGHREQTTPTTPSPEPGGTPEPPGSARESSKERKGKSSHKRMYSTVRPSRTKDLEDQPRDTDANAPSDETPPPSSSRGHRKRKHGVGESKEAPAALVHRQRSNDIVIRPPDDHGSGLATPVQAHPQSPLHRQPSTSDPGDLTAAAAAAAVVVVEETAAGRESDSGGGGTGESAK
jgi:hypothetical protein